MPHPSGPSARPQHIPALDGVRFLAVALVILHHLTGGSHTSNLLRLIGLQAGNGIGPTLFFVLSGVLLTPVILNARNAPHRYRNFLARRALRIFPLYLGYLAVAILATYAFTGRPIQHAWVFAFFLQNTFLTAASNTGSVLPMYHLWTLAVQDQFYLLWPLLLWNCNSIRTMRQLCYAIIVISFASRLIIIHPAFTFDLFGRILPARAGEMCLGALLALDIREKASRVKTLTSQVTATTSLRTACLPLTTILLFWMWHGLSFETSLGSVVGLQLIALVSAALIAVALNPATWSARILGSKLLALGGKKYAFAMYIFHPMLLEMSTHLPIASKALRLLLFGVTTVVLSGLSYRFYESSFLHMKLGRTEPSRPVGPIRLAH
jgi:peptidoglycan/LPS O-acetylase OafA/YrhL